MADSSPIKRDSLSVSDITLVPFLTFDGRAEEAMDFYMSVFPDARRLGLVRFEDSEYGTAGKVLNGQLSIKGERILFMDLPEGQSPPFSWSISLYVNCSDETEFDHAFERLAESGTVMMGPEPVLDLRKVAWVTDRFGVTWQLVWA